MATGKQIPSAQNADLTTSTIKVEGEKVPDTVSVMSILVQKEANRIPVAKIVILDGDPAHQTFSWSEADHFVPGKQIEIFAGYHNDEALIFKGIIIKHSLKIRESGASLLLVDCKDEGVKMTIGRKSRYFYESTDSDVMEELIGPYGLEAEVSASTVTHPELVQYCVSDWDFLLTRAEVNGKICLLENGKLTVGEPNFTTDPVVQVTYGDTMLAFDAEIDARHQLKKVVSRAWNFADQEMVITESEEPEVVSGGNLDASELAEVIGLDEFELAHGGKANEAELLAWSNAQILRNRMSKVRGRVKFQGIPQVVPGSMIELQGVGERFNGKVYVSAVRHEIVDGSWTVDVQFGFNPEWFSETYETSQPPASGLFPAVSGLQVGLVTQLAGDPEGENRILVRLPVISPEEDGVWTRIASLDAGENRGAFFRPEIGDEVIVGFINDDPRQAVMLGMLNSSNKPAPLSESDDNHEKGFVTRSGLKLLFNDDQQSILIETDTGKTIRLSEEDGVIELTDDHGNKLLMDADGISIESAADLQLKATGDINIEGVNINAKASAQLKAEGAAGAEVSSSGNAVLKGALVQIN